MGRSEVLDDYIRIDLPNAVIRTEQLAQQGMFVGWQTGGVLDGAIEAIKKHNIKGDVVLLSGDSGWKNVDKLMTK